jgi:hypothetical protein
MDFKRGYQAVGTSMPLPQYAVKDEGRLGYRKWGALMPVAFAAMLFGGAYFGSRYTTSSQDVGQLERESTAALPSTSSYSGSNRSSGKRSAGGSKDEICAGQATTTFTTTACSCRLTEPVLKVRDMTPASSIGGTGRRCP